MTLIKRKIENNGMDPELLHPERTHRSEDQKKISFIIHGKTPGKNKLLYDLRCAFRGSELSFNITRYPQHAITLAAGATMNGYTHIISIGGDGTLNEVINGLVNARDATPAALNPYVGLLPRGRGNDFARMMHITPDIQTLKENIDLGHYQTIDLARARYTNHENDQVSRYFVNITDIGMGGIIAKKLAGYPQWLGARVSFPFAIVSTLISYRPQRVSIISDGKRKEREIMNLIIANGKYFGNGLGIAPDASPDDGLLSIVVIGKVSIADYVKLIGKVKRSEKINHPEMEYFSCRQIQAIASGTNLLIDMDGEFAGYDPLTVEVCPQALRMICSRRMY